MADILSETRVGERSLAAYGKFIKPALRRDILAASKSLKGLSVLHVNSTSAGGGVAELLRSQIPLERGLGVDSHWIVINGDKQDKFFAVTKKMHNLFQGEKGRLSEKEKKTYLGHNRMAFGDFRKIVEKIKPDAVIFHDTQPLPLVGALEGVCKKPKTALRIHVDLSAPNASILKFIRPLALKCDRLVVTHPRYRPEWFPKNRTDIIYPSIDPLAPKNKILSASDIKILAKKYGVNVKEKIISQVSRFDPWKDPIGVIEAFNLARKKVIDLKLILIGSTANDDPEAKEVYENVKKFANGDPKIVLITKSDDTLVNLIQTASRVVLQKSIREGFGLTVTEAMWKKKAVIGGKTTGISLQIEHGKDGYLVSSVRQAANFIVKLLENPKLAEKMGAAARKTVQEKFLTPAMVLKHLKLYSKLLK